MPDGFYASGDTIKLSGTSASLSSDFEISSGLYLLIEAGQTLTIDSGATLTIAAGGTLINEDTITGSGTLELLGALEEIGTIKVTVPIQTSGRSAADSKIRGAGRSIKVQSSSMGRASVYNLRGELVKQQIVRQGETEISGLKAGVYLVKLSNGASGMARIR